MDNERDLAMFRALADPTRIAIMRFLTVEKRCACQLLPRLDVKQPTLSHHLSILVAAGLVVAERKGKWVWYGIDPNGLDALRGFFATVGADADPIGACGRE